MSALENIARLRCLVEQLPALGEDGQWFAEALGKYLDGASQGVTLEQVLGLSPRRGEVPWWRAEQQIRRRAAARALFEAAEGADARDVHLRLMRFANGRGRHAGLETGADRFAVAARDYLHAAGDVPDSPRTLHRAAFGS